MATSWRTTIEYWNKQGQTAEQIASRIYETYPAKAFEKIHNWDLQHAIKRAVADELNVPITSILISGSAQLGESIHSPKMFDPQTSDLDLAIVDKENFLKLGALVQRETKDFLDLTKFPKLQNINNVSQLYKDNYCKGFIHTFMIPPSEEKRKIVDFFGKLTIKHQTKFTEISASFYASLQSFETKQAHLIRMVK